jgi:hypothetical protein
MREGNNLFYQPCCKINFSFSILKLIYLALPQHRAGIVLVGSKSAAYYIQV